MRVVGWDVPLDRTVSAHVAGKLLRIDPTTLRKAAKAGYVEVVKGPHSGGREAMYATLEEWLRGAREFMARTRKEGMLGRKEAAKLLGVPVSVIGRMLDEGYVDCDRIQVGGREYRVAPPEEWRRAYEVYRTAHPMRRRLERRREKREETKELKAWKGVTPEKIEERMQELAERREAFRAFVLAVQRGLPLGDGAFRVLDGDINTL